MLPTIWNDRLFNDFFDDSFAPFEEFERHNPLYGKRAANVMKTDVRETENGYELDIDLPGFKKEDIQIDVENEVLTISAKRSEEKKDEKHNVVKRERVYGSFSRSFDVSGINVDGIEAAYTDGVLTLTMPKKQELLPVSRRLEIK